MKTCATGAVDYFASRPARISVQRLYEQKSYGLMNQPTERMAEPSVPSLRRQRGHPISRRGSERGANTFQLRKAKLRAPTSMWAELINRTGRRSRLSAGFKLC